MGTLAGPDQAPLLGCLRQEHRGIGGLYFITTMVICSFILFASVRLSWDSQAVAMADNLAYISSINVAVNSYMDNVRIPAGNYTGNLPLTNHPYNPMLRNAGLISGSDQCNECYVYWDGRNAVVQFGEFRTSLNSWVRPHQQESVIEQD